MLFISAHVLGSIDNHCKQACPEAVIETLRFPLFTDVYKKPPSSVSTIINSVSEFCVLCELKVTRPIGSIIPEGGYLIIYRAQVLL